MEQRSKVSLSMWERGREQRFTASCEELHSWAEHRPGVKGPVNRTRQTNLKRGEGQRVFEGR